MEFLFCDIKIFANLLFSKIEKLVEFKLQNNIYNNNNPNFPNKAKRT
jgi:hypothetical protein